MKNLLLPILLLIGSHLFAQFDTINKKKIVIKVYAGRALPQGSFSDQNSTRTSGFAEKGVVGGFSLGLPVSKNVQVDFDLLRASYKIDERAFFNSYYQEYIIQIQNQFPTTNVGWSISTGSYINTNAFVSLKLSTSEDAFKFYVKPGIGMSWFNVPGLSENVKIRDDELTSNTTYETATSLMFNLSAGLEIKLSENIFFDFNVQYLFSEFETDGSLYAEDQNGNTFFYSETSRFDFSTINLALGLVFYIETD